MRRRYGITWPLLTLLIAGAVAIVAYQFGLSAHGPAAAAPFTGQYGWPFGLFWLIPLAFVVLFCSGIGRRGLGWYRGSEPAGRSVSGVESQFTKWHEREHSVESRL